jgi:hypothetical protein
LIAVATAAATPAVTLAPSTAPSRGIHDVTVGLVSLGNIDAGALLFAMPSQAAPPVLHGSSFR